MRRDEALLVDMYQASKQIAIFKADISFEQFRTDAKTQSAIIHQFLLIGEIAKILSENFKKSKPIHSVVSYGKNAG